MPLAPDGPDAPASDVEHPTARRRRPARTQVAVLIGAAVLVVWHLAAPLGAAGNGTYLAATVGGAIVALMPVAGSPERSPWRWVAVGLTLSATAEVVYWSYTAVFDLPEPDVSWADPPWLMSYAAVAIGAARLVGLHRARRGYRDVDALIDMAGVAVVGLLVMWYLVIETTVAESSTSLATRVLWSAYPICDVVLLTLVVGAAIARGQRHQRGLVLLSLGIVCWVLSDVGYAIVGTDELTAWMDSGWMVAAALIGLAVRAGRSDAAGRADLAPDADAEPAVGGHSAGRVRLAIGMLPLLVAPILSVWVDARGGRPNLWMTTIATAMLGALAYARCLRLVANNEARARELDASEHYYRMLATNSSDAVVVVDSHGRIHNESPTAARLLGVPAPTIGLDLLGARSPLDHASFADLLAKAALLPGEVVEGEVRILRGDHTEQWLDVRAADMVDDDIVAGIVINLHDITDRKRSEGELRTRAFHDGLTGLANRALFRDRIEHALSARSRTAVDPCVIFVDLDGFKYVNDTLGHETGDELLIQISRRLVGTVRPGDTVARLGGDEFAILLESASAVADGPSVAARVLEVVREPIVVNGRSLRISCSVGLARADEDADSSSLLRHADMAMYEAKARGKARWAIYDPAMGDASRERLMLEADLHRALDLQQFELEYQPIVSIADGALTGFEALLRWRHPTLGTVGPDRFIPILEENGRIVEVGAWVLETASATLVGWREQHPNDTEALTMSVNVSSVQLSSPTFVATVERVLTRTGLPAGRLVLEVTETTLVEDSDNAAAALGRLHELGTRLAIDDFGTGYSSLSYLRQFPVDVLKIDRSFIQAIEPDGPLPTIVKGVLELTHTLGIEAVAEGIEQAEQLARLGEHQCAKGQGYLFARPMRAADALRFLEARVTPAEAA